MGGAKAARSTTDVPRCPRPPTFAHPARDADGQRVRRARRAWPRHALLLIDARAPERFRGEIEPLDPVAGHIPGARNRPYTLNLDADGTFKHPAFLRAEFDALLDGAPHELVVHQCGSGVTACHNMLAMEIAGLPGTRLYPGLVERMVRRSGAAGRTWTVVRATAGAVRHDAPCAPRQPVDQRASQRSVSGQAASSR